MNRKHIALIALGCMVVGPKILGASPGTKPLSVPSKPNVQPNSPSAPASPLKPNVQPNTASVPTIEERLEHGAYQIWKQEVIGVVRASYSASTTKDTYVILESILKSKDLQVISTRCNRMSALYNEAKKTETELAHIFGALQFVHDTLQEKTEKPITSKETLNEKNLANSVVYIQHAYNKALETGTGPISDVLKNLITDVSKLCGKTEQELGKIVYEQLGANNFHLRTYLAQANKSYVSEKK